MGSQTSGEALNLNGPGTNDFVRVVNNKATCPDCYSSAAAVSAGQNAGAEGPTSVFVNVLGNYVTDASCELPAGVTTAGSPAGISNKQYHDFYMVGDDINFEWNRVSSSCAFNGMQINFGADNNTVGFTNQNINNNDFSEVNGACINLATVDPSRGYVNVNNNILHHCGIQEASDSIGAPTNHTCIASPAEGFSSGTGTAKVYNNTMYDCSSIQNTVSTNQGCFKFSGAAQPNLQYNLVNNLCYQPTYSTLGSNTVWTNNAGGTTISGSNNLFFYQAGTPTNANTSLPAFGTFGMLNADPLYQSAANGPWTNFKLQVSSPAIAAGTATGAPSTDFRGILRPNPPAMGALEYAALPSATVIYTETATSNNADSLGNTATKKTLGNVGTGCTGGTTITPVGFPVGQLYATSAIATTAIAAGCATQGSVTATISGTGTVAVDNGKGSGGTDSPSAVTATYGANTNDSICTGDPSNALATPYPGLAPAACVPNATFTFAQTTAPSFGNSDVLATSVYVSNSTTLDTASHVYFDQYWCVDDLSTLHDWEFEPNINSSPTAYGASNGAFFGWGFHWNSTAQMFQYCPQNCSAWTTVKLVDITGTTPTLTTYPLTNGHCYRTRNYDHRLPTCSFSSTQNCAFYDYFTIYDVTAATAPITYYVIDATTDQPAAFIPVDNHTFSSGVYDHMQLDMTTANATTQVRVISHTMTLFK